MCDVARAPSGCAVDEDFVFFWFGEDDALLSCVPSCDFYAKSSNLDHAVTMVRACSMRRFLLHRVHSTPP